MCNMLKKSWENKTPDQLVKLKVCEKLQNSYQNLLIVLCVVKVYCDICTTGARIDSVSFVELCNNLWAVRMGKQISDILLYIQE